MLLIPLSVSRSSTTDTFIFNLYENKKKLQPYENKKTPTTIDTNASLTTLFDNHMELLYRRPIAWITITIYIPVCNKWIVVLYTDTFTTGVRVFICWYNRNTIEKYLYKQSEIVYKVFLVQLHQTIKYYHFVYNIYMSCLLFSSSLCI